MGLGGSRQWMAKHIVKQHYIFGVQSDVSKLLEYRKNVFMSDWADLQFENELQIKLIGD